MYTKLYLIIMMIIVLLEYVCIQLYMCNILYGTCYILCIIPTPKMVLTDIDPSMSILRKITSRCDIQPCSTLNIIWIRNGMTSSIVSAIIGQDQFVPFHRWLCNEYRVSTIGKVLEFYIINILFKNNRKLKWIVISLLVQLITNTIIWHSTTNRRLVHKAPALRHIRK